MVSSMCDYAPENTSERGSRLGSGATFRFQRDSVAGKSSDETVRGKDYDFECFTGPSY